MSQTEPGSHLDPHANTASTDWIVWSRGHRLALERLSFAIKSRAPLTLFLGPEGSGRTLLIHELVRQEADKVRLGVLSAAETSAGHVLVDVLRAFGEAVEQGPGHQQAESLVARITSTIATSSSPPALIVDDADHLSDDDISALCSLTAAPGSGQPVLKLIFVGEPGLVSHMAARWPELTGPHFTLDPLDAEETQGFIRNTLSKDASAVAPFTDAALDAVFAQTHGLPLAIRSLHDRCQTEATRQGLTAIDETLVNRLGHGSTAHGARQGGTAPPDDTLRDRSALSLLTAPRLIAAAALCSAAALWYAADDQRVAAITTAVAEAVGGLSLQPPTDAETDAALVQEAEARITRINSLMTGIGDSAAERFRAGVDMGETAPEAAVAAYALAALSGHERAAIYLGQIYELGEGVPADPLRARAWYDLAGLDPDNALAPEDAANAIAPPVLLHAGWDQAARDIDLVWTSGAGTAPSHFNVEFTLGDGKVLAAAEGIALSAARLPRPAGATHWRVTATDADTDAARSSPWISLDLD